MKEREKKLIGENGRRRLFVPAKDVESALSDEDGEDATLKVEQAYDEDSGDEMVKEFEMDATDISVVAFEIDVFIVLAGAWPSSNLDFIDQVRVPAYWG